ncbi:MAG TPA: UDP-N-acetylglucosamine 2-epimerase [Methylotenera sp.]|nr:UDP-N-acetylglucosamine 2-epimerase [Methylotenera sp.]HPH04758.1 UDP-N-acetylglucosamine 2-epimerase [Methylotenera sp.]HPN01201.1 UDP-N-acetylglucosamine 2-epimerase [Methylotenera sp.]
MRKVCYITGTRADFGLMQATLKAIDGSNTLELAVLVTGMHLDEQFGLTIQDVKKSNLPIAATVKSDSTESSGESMAKGIGRMILGFVDELIKIKPNIVLLLGDRGEMLAGAIAAIHLNIPIVHIHGGELSGTVDEPIRHAISKLAHYHFTSTESAKNRLIRMGEQPANIFVTGAPGLVGIVSSALLKREQLFDEVGFSHSDCIALLLYHPVLQESSNAGKVVKTMLDILKNLNVKVIALLPNADAGSLGVRQVLQARHDNVNVILATHFERDKFLSCMAAVDFIIGNSSAGIIEAGTFGTPVINVGIRQNKRERNVNVIDVTDDASDMKNAIQKAILEKRFEKNNIYGDGKADVNIVNLLSSIPLSNDLLCKTNAY